VEALDAELVRCKDAYLRLEEKMKFMVETPLGLQKQVHSSKLKTLDELIPGSGHAKYWRTQLKAQILPGVVSRM
jgi:hypothetical protein